MTRLRNRRWLVLALILVGLGLVLIPAAITIKNNEYRVATWLAKSTLSPVDQGALMAGVLRASRFALAAKAPDGRAGAFLFDRETAQRYGLTVDPRVVGRSHRRPFRLFGLVASTGLRSRDDRFDVDRQLAAAASALDEYRRELSPRLTVLGPAADDPELAAVLAVVSLGEGLETVIQALEHGELGRLARAETDGTREENPFLAPPLLWRLTRDAQPTDTVEDKFLQRVRRTWISTRIYRQTLPQLQTRSHPTLFEYINAYKGVLVELTGAAKWSLHLIFGGVAYAFTSLALGACGVGRRRRIAWALALAATLAVGVELADAMDIRQTGKRFDATGSAADAVVTVLLPIAGWAWQRRRDRDRVLG